MISKQQVQELLSGGGTVLGKNGQKIGKFGQVFLDDETGRPEWVTAHTGLFGTSETFIPLSGATMEGDTVTVAYDKQTVKDAPRINDKDGHLSPQAEEELYRYYGLPYGDAQDESAQGGQQGQAGRHAAPDQQAGGDAAAAQDVAHTGMARQSSAGTQSGSRSRMRRYVVNEDAITTVPVGREAAHPEREPLTEDPPSAGRPAPERASAEQEETLRGQRRVIDEETVPVENVRLETETIAGEEQLSEHGGKEQLEDEGTDKPGAGPDTENFRSREEH